jgi:pimeloyl-ACP methyl ester carboxylesterase
MRHGDQTERGAVHDDWEWLVIFFAKRSYYSRIEETPVLIYGGMADGLIPPHQFAALQTAVRGPRRLALINDANHVDVWTKGGAGHVLRFLQTVAENVRHANT